MACKIQLLFSVLSLFGVSDELRLNQDLLSSAGVLECRAVLAEGVNTDSVRNALTEAIPPARGVEGSSTVSMLWPDVLSDYHAYTGNHAFFSRMAGSPLVEIMDYWRRFETDSGLLALPNSPERGESWSSSVASKGGALLNIMYYHAMHGVSELRDAAGHNAFYYARKSDLLARRIRADFFDESTGLFFDIPGSGVSSLELNIAAARFGLLPEASLPLVFELIQDGRLPKDVLFASYAIELCFLHGREELGYDLLTAIDEHPWTTIPAHLKTRYLFGLEPGAPGWSEVAFAPKLPPQVARLSRRFSVPGGRISVIYEEGVGYRISVPAGRAVRVASREGEPVMIKNAASHTTQEFSAELLKTLDAHGWEERVGDETLVWISIDEQMLRVLKGRKLIYHARCASAKNGVGSLIDSLKTPVGWHTVANKIGEGAAFGRVFRARRPTSEIWRPGGDASEDLVLTRLLHLTGEELGKNKGGDVDSYMRNIYIHGTNDEGRIGTPSSHGCIRLTNDDVIEVFELVATGAHVLITADAESE